jgi:hypothetical protein
MSQTGGKQLSSRERLLAVLGIAGVVMFVLFLYRPVPPGAVFEDLGELAPLPDSFAVYQQRQTGDPFSLYDAGQYDRFIARMNAEFPEPTEGQLLYLGSAQLLADRLSDAVYSLRRVVVSDDSLLAAEARWQLAQAYLRSEEAAPARDELRHLSGRRAHRSFEAARKLSVLETRLPDEVAAE